MRESWDNYFMRIAFIVATRSTCLALPVGAVIVRDQRILATGYNGPPSGMTHCIDQGFCYSGVVVCSNSDKPSRSIHAEANAIGQCASLGIPTKDAVLYVTLQPCLNCLKICLAAGITNVVYAEPNPKACQLFDVSQRHHVYEH